MFNLLNISKEYFDIFKKLYKDKKKYVRGILKPNELYTEIIGIVSKKSFFMTDKREIK